MKGNKYLLEENVYYYLFIFKDIDNLVKLTKGYSGADLRNLFAEASYIPLRCYTDIANLNPEDIRPTNY